MHGSFNAKHTEKLLGMRYAKRLANCVFNAKKTKTIRLRYAKFLGNYVGTIQNKRFAMRNIALRKFPYCLNLQLSTQQVCHRRTTTLQLLHQRLHHCEQKNDTFNKCKRAQTCICASDQNGCFHLTFGFGFYAQTVLWRFVPLHGRKLQAKTHTRGVGFEKI